jgi:hypothetical protein
MAVTAISSLKQLEKKLEKLNVAAMRRKDDLLVARKKLALVNAEIRQVKQEIKNARAVLNGTGD